MTTINYPECPFDNIALSLSGGGVWAVGFHLGSMAYLDRIGFLKKANSLSTVSGGTVVGWLTCPKEDGKEAKFKDQDVQNLFDELKKDWLSLTDDAFVFVDERKRASDVLAPVE